MYCPNDDAHPGLPPTMLGLGEYDTDKGPRRYWVCPECGAEVAVTVGQLVP